MPDRQLAYEVEVDGAVTRVEGDAHVLVPWPARALASGERREVRVRVETDAGLGAWSEPVAVEAGLLTTADWSASWISTGASTDDQPGRAGHRPAYRLRGEVAVERPVVRARLYATAHGIYELALDGQRVGTDELTPGYTEYASHTQVQTYDVTVSMAPGHARGRGAARRRVVPRPGRHAPRPRPVGHRDGVPRPAATSSTRTAATTVVGTDATWRWAPSHITEPT